MKIELLKVTGLSCGGCVNSLTQALKAINGVTDVNVTLATGDTTIKYDEHLTSPEQLKIAVADAGYTVE